VKWSDQGIRPIREEVSGVVRLEGPGVRKRLSGLSLVFEGRCLCLILRTCILVRVPASSLGRIFAAFADFFSRLTLTKIVPFGNR
jgi:hypothetical protein